MSESEQSSSNFAYHTGRILGKYQLLGLIDRGGMAEVYKSYHPELERDLAVKILYPHFTDVPGFVERFRREAKAAAALRHPNIIQIFDFAHTEDGLYYMVLEYIDGQPLESFLNAQAPLTLSQTLTLFRQIASATQYAHDHGLIHRDIKPANILLDKKGQAYLTDFGIAQIMGMSRLTQTDTKAGTPIYMAPEQIETQPVNATADVYSLGMLLYRMLTNRLPFESDNPTLIMVQKLTKPPTPPRQFKPDLPAEVEEILMTALAYEPENRFPDVVSMTWALEDAYSAVPEIVLADTAVTQTTLGPGGLPLNRLDHYEIQETLPHSETNLSHRFIAHNQMLGGLAILEVQKTVESNSRELFLQRMTAVSELEHPHIAPVAFINHTEDGRSYAALTYTPGMSLAAKIEAETMTLLRALHLARQIAYALQTVHAINIVHGDLRPETIFVEEEECIRLMGLGPVAGTPSVQDNIQAFGRLLQSMLPETELSPEHPASLLVANCLATSTPRYDSMTAIRAALDEVLATELDRVTNPQLARSPRRFLPVATILVLLILIAALLVPRLRSGTTAAPLTTPSTEAAIGEAIEPGAIRLVAIVYNPGGDEADGEYVVIQNRGTASVSLTNWRLENLASQPQSFIFPPFTLAAGDQANIRTGQGDNSEMNIYWGSETAIWDNAGDTASLYDDAGTLIDRCTYNGGGETAICP
jgi:serine/threonine protein kinase